MSNEIRSVQNLLKFLCKIVKFSAGGDFWFESNESLVYRIYHYLWFFLFYVMFALECMEAVLYEYPTDLHNDAVSFVLGHLTVVIRVRCMIYYKSEARKLSQDVVKVLKEHESEEVINMQFKKVNSAIYLQGFAIFSSMNFFFIEGIRRVYVDGTPFIAVVTYYPKYEDNSTIALAVRIAIFIIHYYFLFNMLCSDCLAIGYLIIISSKFMTLRKYFYNLSELCDVKSEVMNAVELRAWFKEKCFEGLKIHEELIRLSKVIQDIFGAVISIQVCESTFVTIQIMMQIAVTADLTLTMVIMYLSYLIALLFTVALYTWNGGELTYQASLIDTAIFHCGWYKHEMEQNKNKDLRRLILMGCIQAQKPIVLKAFGLHTISYESFVGVLKTSYSIFALLYR